MRAIVLALVFLFGLAASAVAGDVAAAQGVIQEQEQAFSRGDAAAQTADKVLANGGDF